MRVQDGRSANLATIQIEKTTITYSLELALDSLRILGKIIHRSINELHKYLFSSSSSHNLCSLEVITLRRPKLDPAMLII